MFDAFLYVGMMIHLCVHHPDLPFCPTGDGIVFGSGQITYLPQPQFHILAHRAFVYCYPVNRTDHIKAICEDIQYVEFEQRTTEDKE